MITDRDGSAQDGERTLLVLSGQKCQVRDQAGSNNRSRRSRNATA
jgi:hypothetical protein